MKTKIHLEHEEYLIITLLLIGGILAVVGLYTVIADFIHWLSGALAQVNLN